MMVARSPPNGGGAHAPGAADEAVDRRPKGSGTGGNHSGRRATRPPRACGRRHEPGDATVLAVVALVAKSREGGPTDAEGAAARSHEGPRKESRLRARTLGVEDRAWLIFPIATTSTYSPRSRASYMNISVFRPKVWTSSSQTGIPASRHRSIRATKNSPGPCGPPPLHELEDEAGMLLRVPGDHLVEVPHRHLDRTVAEFGVVERHVVDLGVEGDPRLAPGGVADLVPSSCFDP